MPFTKLVGWRNSHASCKFVIFFSYLNLSFNHLVGRIPIGTQIQSFPASSFEGNDRLYGFPLTENPEDKKPATLTKLELWRLTWKIDCNFVSVELGMILGDRIIIFFSLLIWKRWREWYWQLINKILCWIFPPMHLEYVTKRGQTYANLRRQVLVINNECASEIMTQ